MQPSANVGLKEFHKWIHSLGHTQLLIRLADWAKAELSLRLRYVMVASVAGLSVCVGLSAWRFLLRGTGSVTVGSHCGLIHRAKGWRIATPLDLDTVTHDNQFACLLSACACSLLMRCSMS